MYICTWPPPSGNRTVSVKMTSNPLIGFDPAIFNVLGVQETTSTSNCKTKYAYTLSKENFEKWRWIPSKVRFLYQCSDHLSHSKNFTSLFPLIFLSKHISLYALGRIRWILDIIWPLNQHFKLKNQRNWLNQVWMWKFWNVINCILLHWYKHLTLIRVFFSCSTCGFTNSQFSIHNQKNSWESEFLKPTASCVIDSGLLCQLF